MTDEGGRHCVCLCIASPSGEKIREFGRHGSGHGEFRSPHGVAVDGEGNVLVVDQEYRSLQQKAIFLEQWILKV